jgi:hypothetical protein
VEEIVVMDHVSEIVMVNAKMFVVLHVQLIAIQVVKVIVKVLVELVQLHVLDALEIVKELVQSLVILLALEDVEEVIALVSVKDVHLLAKGYVKVVVVRVVKMDAMVQQLEDVTAVLLSVWQVLMQKQLMDKKIKGETQPTSFSLFFILLNTLFVTVTISLP